MKVFPSFCLLFNNFAEDIRGSWDIVPLELEKTVLVGDAASFRDSYQSENIPIEISRNLASSNFIPSLGNFSIQYNLSVLAIVLTIMSSNEVVEYMSCVIS